MQAYGGSGSVGGGSGTAYSDCGGVGTALIMDANGRWMKEEQVIDDTTVIVAHLDVKA